MRRYILSGAPGAGKTILLRRLELEGYGVVEEAATDLIALAGARGVEKHWEEPGFVDDIVALQRRRQRRADAWPDEVVVFDRSPICTWALAEFLGRAPSDALQAEVERIERERVYERRVFFVELMGRIVPTEARRITLEESTRFAAVHADVYRRFGYELLLVPPADVETRLEAVRGWLQR
jgi:predicted ATPase